MLAETIIGAEIENTRRKQRVKAMVGVTGTQTVLNEMVNRLRNIENLVIPNSVTERKQFIEKLGAIRSEVISTGMLIEEYMLVLESIWEDYDKSSSYTMN